MLCWVLQGPTEVSSKVLVRITAMVLLQGFSYLAAPVSVKLMAPTFGKPPPPRVLKP